MRLKYKRRQGHLIVYVDGWTVQKSLLHKQKLQIPLEIPIFQFPSRFKIQVDSFQTAFTVLENWMKCTAKTGVYTSIPLFLLIWLVATKTWPSGVLDYSKKKDNWQSFHWVTFHSCYSTIFSSQVSITVKKKNKSFKENNQNTKEVWLRCMSDHEWHDITRYNLIMSQKSMIKLYNIKSISHHYSRWHHKL